MRADRLLSIMLLLQVHRRITARELARRLEVSERTIYRDMEALSFAGVPVVAERGAGGGWALMEAYETHLTGLSQAEVQSLFLVAPGRLLEDLGLRRAAEAALIKLLAAIPSMSRRDAEYARQRFHVDAAGWNRTEESVASLPALQEAVWQDRRVVFLYERERCEATERTVDPLGLVAKGRVWYLVAAVGGEPRTYRVSRIRDVRVTGEPSARPEGFDLASYWERSAAAFKAGLPRYTATVRAAPDAVAWVRLGMWFARVEHAEPPDADGWVRFALRFDVEDQACAFALGFGPRMEVLEPPELRDRVARAAEAVAALYAGHTRRETAVPVVSSR